MVRLFSHWLPVGTALQAFLDGVLLFLSVVLAAIWLGTNDVEGLLDILPDALLFAVIMILLNAAVGLYRRRPGRTVTQTAAQLVLALALAVPVAYIVVVILPPTRGWGDSLKITVPVAFLGLAAVRALIAHSSVRPALVRRVLILGTGPEAAAIEQSVPYLGPDIKLIGFYPTKKEGEPGQLPHPHILDSERGLVDTVRRHRIHDIIIAVQERRGGVLPLRELLDCRLAGARVLDRSTFYERALGQVRLDSLYASWLIFGDGFRQDLVRTIVKRAFDILAALVLLVCAAPVLLLTVAAIALESGFPVLYRQERVGLNGRVFRLTKFRSMRLDAERDGTPRWATAQDARVTRVGRVIRKLRIDELPQLFNVLLGDMSVVGPRPERPYFVEQLIAKIPFYAVRHSVKPGITGWAQVRYQYGASLDDAAQKLQYDLYYVKNHSLFLDIVILIDTVGVVVTGQGAH